MLIYTVDVERLVQAVLLANDRLSGICPIVRVIEIPNEHL